MAEPLGGAGASRFKRHFGGALASFLTATFVFFTREKIRSTNSTLQSNGLQGVLFLLAMRNGTTLNQAVEQAISQYVAPHH